MTDTQTFTALISQAVIDEYLDTGKPVRPADIAHRLTEDNGKSVVSEDKVRRNIRKNHGFVVGCFYQEVEVPTYSTVRAAAYLPNLETLRRIIIAAR